LLDETLEALAPRPDGRYLDATVGGGGHAAALLERAGPGGLLLGLDRDRSTLGIARSRLAPVGDRASLMHGAFGDLGHYLNAVGWSRIDGVLFDLGFSSIQLDSPGRGFSFQQDGLLDMRLDPTAPIPTARDLLATLPEQELADLLFRYGEEPLARRIAREVVRRRAHGSVSTTSELRALVCAVSGGRHGRATDPATRTFQALRIAVNDELGQLAAALPQAISALGPSGRIAVITFHSLEDRIVKQHLATAAAGCICPPDLPECRCGHQPVVSLLWRKPRTPSRQEVARNPRSRSAKLRAAVKL